MTFLHGPEHMPSRLLRLLVMMVQRRCLTGTGRSLISSSDYASVSSALGRPTPSSTPPGNEVIKAP